MRLVVEYSRGEILGAVDPDFIHHGEYRKELKKPRLVGAKGRHLTFETKSSDYDENGKTYLQHILYVNIKYFTRDKTIDPLEAVALVIEEGDMTVRCTCPSAKWWGYNYITTQLDSIYGHKQNKAPNIRNPKQRGILCKHLHNVLEYIPDIRGIIEDQLILAVFKELGTPKDIWKLYMKRKK